MSDYDVDDNDAVYNLNDEENFSNIDVNNSHNDDGLSLVERLLGVIVAPRDTLMYLAEESSLVFPALMIGISSFLYYLIRIVPFQNFIKNYDQIINGKISESVIQSSAWNSAIVGAIISAPVALLLWVFGAAILMFFTKLFGGEIDFSRMLIITGYSQIIVVIFYVLSVVIGFISGEFITNFSLGIISNYLIPQFNNSIIYGSLRSIDLFNIWQFIIISRGISSVAEIDDSKAYMLSFAVLILLSFISAQVMKFI